MHNAKAVIFDWDNTLVDTWAIIHEALTHTFTTYGVVPWTLMETKTQSYRSARDYFPEIFHHDWHDAVDTFNARYRALAVNLRPIDGTEEVLQALNARGIPLAVVSNKAGFLLREEARKLGWKHYFKALVGSGDASNDKPHPATVALALDGCEIARGPHVLFVGDTSVDVTCARNGDCTPVYYHGDDATCHAIDEDVAVIKNLRDLL